MRGDLGRTGVSDSVIDDAVLILSELLSNAWRHGSPWRSGPGGGTVLAAWSVDEDDRVTVEVTDGGGPTRPLPAKPSVTARGGRGLNIIRSLADDWGVRDGRGEVTVWALLPADTGFSGRVMLPTGLGAELRAELEPGLRTNGGVNGGVNGGASAGSGIVANIDTNIDPDFDRELGFADLDELA